MFVTYFLLYFEIIATNTNNQLKPILKHGAVNQT